MAVDGAALPVEPGRISSTVGPFFDPALFDGVFLALHGAMRGAGELVLHESSGFARYRE